MSSLAAARADNFYYPPDFDPDKHQTLNKYNGQHPLRERASKLDQGILVIRFEVPFNIWCEKCGEHIAKGERFNAEKKAIGQYHSTKVLQFTMTHHCGSKITIQTDPKRAEYLVIEGARKKEESYSAADAEVIELPDDAERERRDRDPLYRLEFQQGAKAKALSGAERVAAIQDAADARGADPYSLNRAMRAALRGEKRGAAALDARRQELGLPEEVSLLAPSEGDALAAQVAFLTSSARATARAEANRKRILDQDIFTSSSGGEMTAASVHVRVGVATGSRPPGAAAAMPPPPPKRPVLGLAPVKVRAVAAGPAASGQAPAAGVEGEAGGTVQQHQQEQQQQPEPEGRVVAQETLPAARAVVVSSGEDNGRASGAQQQHRTGAAAAMGASNSLRGAGGSNSSGGPMTAAVPGGRPPPGAAALAAAAARAAARPEARRNPAHASAMTKSSGHHAAGSLRPAAAHAPGRSGGSAPASNGLAVAGANKRSIKDRAAELQKRRQGLGGAGLALSRPEL